MGGRHIIFTWYAYDIWYTIYGLFKTVENIIDQWIKAITVKYLDHGQQ